MSAFYTLQLTAAELNLVIRNLTESAHRWRILIEESPFPETTESARNEWLSLISVLEKIDPPLGI